MKVVLMLALALFATAPARAADLDDFLKRAGKLESTWEKAKPLCICMDGSLALHTRLGTLEVFEAVDTSRRVGVRCVVPRFGAASRAFVSTSACIDFQVLAK